MSLRPGDNRQIGFAPCRQPHVEVQVERQALRGLAEPITDPMRIADFLELRLSGIRS